MNGLYCYVEHVDNFFASHFKDGSLNVWLGLCGDESEYNVGFFNWEDLRHNWH